MKTALICFSDAGAKLAVRVAGLLGQAAADIHSTAKYAGRYGFTAHETVSGDMGALFSSHDALIFICACGIAVRSIAPHLKSKTEDPAVLVLDDGGRYVIPILSGHIGGANALARSLAEQLGAVPVITTATDGQGRFSCDAWAVTHNCAISSMEAAKEVSAAILTGEVPVRSEYPLPDPLPAGLVPGDHGIYIGIRMHDAALRLIPRITVAGIGCRRGTPADAILDALSSTLESHGIDIRSVCRIASIDAKKDEAGLNECADRLGVPLSFYSAEELAAVPGTFSASEFVRETVGVDNVCERAAVLAGGSLIIPKTAAGGVTVAAAVLDWRVAF